MGKGLACFFDLPIFLSPKGGSIIGNNYVFSINKGFGNRLSHFNSSDHII